MSDSDTAHKFFDSFGDDIAWRLCNRDLYERHLAALLTETRTKALSEKEAEIARLREALMPFSALYESSKPLGISRFPHSASWAANFEDIQDMLIVGHLRKAYAALKAEGGEI